MFDHIFTFILFDALIISSGKNVQKFHHHHHEVREQGDEAQKFLNFDTAKMIIGESIDYAMKSVLVPPPAKAFVTVGQM